MCVVLAYGNAKSSRFQEYSSLLSHSLSRRRLGATGSITRKQIIIHVLPIPVVTGERWALTNLTSSSFIHHTCKGKSWCYTPLLIFFLSFPQVHTRHIRKRWISRCRKSALILTMRQLYLITLLAPTTIIYFSSLLFPTWSDVFCGAYYGER